MVVLSAPEPLPLAPPRHVQPIGPPPGAWPSLWHATKEAGRPIERFLQLQSSSGVVLLVSALAALLWANSPSAASYVALWHLPVEVRVGSFACTRSVEWLVNDGLMAIFFFVVGLEVRREMHHGELSGWKRAGLPLAAACGGMLVPACVAFGITHASAAHRGWAIPMATDIAFAVGVLALLGKRVPPALRVLLLALAVIDDLGAILVIAVFYSDGIVWSGLLLAAGALTAIYTLQKLGVRRQLAYAAPAFLVWVGACVAGVHPTLAGVAVGFSTPVRAWPPREDVSPNQRLVDSLHPWVAFGIMPLFALVNAGVRLDELSFAGDAWRAAAASGAGLLLGKPVGVVGVTFVLLRLGVVKLPAGLGRRHVVLLGVLAAIGFTMSLFLAQLAYPTGALLGASKVGVLVASISAGIGALVLGRWLLPRIDDPQAAESESEAEASSER